MRLRSNDYLFNGWSQRRISYVREREWRRERMRVYRALILILILRKLLILSLFHSILIQPYLVIFQFLPNYHLLLPKLPNKPFFWTSTLARIFQISKFKPKARLGTMMSQPIILSDEEDHDLLSTPFNPIQSKKRRTEPDPDPKPIPADVVLLDDDPTPQKPGPTFVPETPLSDVAIVKCSSRAPSGSRTRVSNSDLESSGKIPLLNFPVVYMFVKMPQWWIFFFFHSRPWDADVWRHNRQMLF